MRTIYINGNVITVDEGMPIAEAVVVNKGKIAFVGSTEDALKYKGIFTKVLNLEGKTMLPGMIDGHSHFFYNSLVESFMVNLGAPPLGDITSIEDIIVKFKRFITDNNIKPGSTVIGMGVDESLLKEGRLPTRADLDRVSTENGIYAVHETGSVGVVTWIILDAVQSEENVKHSEGGVILRYEGTTKPNGVLEETAHMALMFKYFPKPKATQLPKIARNGQRAYTKYGITTVQDGGLKPQFATALNIFNKLGLLKIDVVGYFFCENVEDVKYLLELPNYMKYNKRFKVGGAKVLLDGSPQAKTAWLSKPYHIVPEGKPADYSGYPMVEDEDKLQDIFNEIVKNKVQVLTHTNGDEASEQLIRVFEKAVKNTGIKDNLRPVMIHAQTVREDQLDRMKKIDMMPSFFAMHTYFWGDWHINSVLGKERAYRISPVASAVKRDMPFTLHCDTPILPPHLSYLLWTAVNRKTRSGEVIGPDQTISVMEAIKGLTIHGAYQNNEEDIKGSITVGKKADLCIINSNPLEIDVDELKNVTVLKTIKDGKIVYKA